jgi:hypothetical protein
MEGERMEEDGMRQHRHTVYLVITGPPFALREVQKRIGRVFLFRIGISRFLLFRWRVKLDFLTLVLSACPGVPNDEDVLLRLPLIIQCLLALAASAHWRKTCIGLQSQMKTSSYTHRRPT